jgi:hypothetical protein
MRVLRLLGGYGISGVPAFAYIRGVVYLLSGLASRYFKAVGIGEYYISYITTREWQNLGL